MKLDQIKELKQRGEPMGIKVTSQEIGGEIYAHYRDYETKDYVTALLHFNHFREEFPEYRNRLVG